MSHGSGPDSRGASPFADLRQWSREHGIVCEVRPALALHRGLLRSTGFEVALAVVVADTRPACAACVGTFGRLRTIAQAAMALAEGRGGGAPCRLRGFDSALRFRWDRGRLVAEVQLVLDVEHEHTSFEGPDDAQLRCVHALQEELAALGVRPAHRA